MKTPKNPREWKRTKIIWPRIDDCVDLGESGPNTREFIPNLKLRKSEWFPSKRSLRDHWYYYNQCLKLNSFRAVIVIKTSGSYYRLINGHHRVSFIRRVLKFKTVPCIVVSKEEWRDDRY